MRTSTATARRMLATVTCLAALTRPAPAQSPSADSVIPAFERANLDTTCDPCKNFFRFANGGWIRSNPIPPAFARWSGFDELLQRNFMILKEVLEQAERDAETDPRSDKGKLGRFYGSCMDSARAERDGAAPIRADLQRIAAIRDRAGVAAEIATLHGIGFAVAFRFEPTQDPSNSARVIADAMQGGLGLPNRDYYFRDDSATAAARDAYRRNIERGLALAGMNAERVRSAAENVIALETALAAASMTPVELRDPDRQNNPMTLPELERLAPAMRWRDYLRTRGVAADSGLNVSQPDFFRALGKELESRPVEAWKDYLAFHVVRAASPWLSSAFVENDFAMTRVLSGARELQPRWRRCLQAADRQLGDALGRAYVEVAFTPEAKARLLAMVDNMRAVFRERIAGLDWMGPETRRRAIEKLDAFGAKIGYPDRWKDYGPIELDRGPFLPNLRRTAAFATREEMDKIGKPVDRNDWAMTPPTVNAYYSAQMNEIAFPAGRVQPPFFSVTYDDASNYGGIGGTIGHELTHGFDDSGRKFDAQGNLRDWWTPEDAALFEERAKVIVRQYDGYRVLDSLHVNGELTLGENIADLGGVTVAYYALQRALKGTSRQTIDGFTPEQRFFLAYAQARRASLRDEYLRLMVRTDPHSPNEFRVNGPYSNMPEFARAWGCKPGDPMVRADSVRARIW